MNDKDSVCEYHYHSGCKCRVCRNGDYVPPTDVQYDEEGKVNAIQVDEPEKGDS